MDALWFDALARAISRRQVLRLVGSGLRRTVLGGAAGIIVARVTPPRPSVVAAMDRGCQLKTVKLWLNAFIPNDPPPDDPRFMRKTVPDGPYRDAVMLERNGKCFLTDDRGFDPNPAAAAKMHSEIEIDVLSGSIINSAQTAPHQVGEVLQIDCATGEVLQRCTADIAEMTFSDVAVQPRPGGQRALQVTFNAAPDRNFSCLAETNDFRSSGTFTITLASERDAAEVTFVGDLAPFPGYEAYVSADGGQAETLFTFPQPREQDAEPLDAAALEKLRTDPVHIEPPQIDVRCAATGCNWSGAWESELGLIQMSESPEQSNLLTGSFQGPIVPCCGKFTATGDSQKIDGLWAYDDQSDAGKFVFEMAGDCAGFTGVWITRFATELQISGRRVCTWGGTWNTDILGQITLNQSPGDPGAGGTYANFEGTGPGSFKGSGDSNKISGDWVADDRAVYGWWEFTMGADCQSFTGWWEYDLTLQGTHGAERRVVTGSR